MWENLSAQQRYLGVKEYGEEQEDSGYLSSIAPQQLVDQPVEDVLIKDQAHGTSFPSKSVIYPNSSGEQEPFIDFPEQKINMSKVVKTPPNQSDSDNESQGNKKEKKSNKKKRVVLKDGLTNVIYKNISKKRRRFFSDLYTTLLDSSWIRCIILFAGGFYGSWAFFAVVYYLISLMHGDFDEDKPDGWVPCILEVHDFSSSFLYSLETQHTIGYGTRQTTTKCKDAILAMSLQSVLGCLIQAFMVGLVFAKLSRPRNRSKTVIFSNKAVINQRNQKLCLIIRTGDMRDDNFILGTQISLKILRRRITMEGEIYQEMKNLKIDPESVSEPCIFFVWPLDIVHVIDESSPFFEMSADDLAREKFELLVVMEGTNETSNMNFQARTSYLPKEIMWGHRFEAMSHYRSDHKTFQINFSTFNSTYEVDTPTCSARTIQTLLTTGKEKPSVPEVHPFMRVRHTTSNLVSDLKRISFRNSMGDYSPLSISRANSNTMTHRPKISKQKSMPASMPAMTSTHTRLMNQSRYQKIPPGSNVPSSSNQGNERINWIMGAPGDNNSKSNNNNINKNEATEPISNNGQGHIPFADSTSSMGSTNTEGQNKKDSF